MSNIIAFHGSHNAAIAIAKDDTFLEVIEAERFLNSKNTGVAQYGVAFTRHYFIREVLKYIKIKYDISHFDICYYSNAHVVEGDLVINMAEYIPADIHIAQDHHLLHAAGTFYQSDDQSALIFSFDGGGSDGFFNVYLAERTSGVQRIAAYPLDLGFPYMVLGEYISYIRKETDLSIGNLVYAGKLMGLAPYGNVREEWLEAFETFYKSGIEGPTHEKIIAELSQAIGIPLSKDDRLIDQDAYDVAATSQKSFENAFFELADTHILKLRNLPIHVTGGCAMNIILNEKIRQKYPDRKIFVAPNSSDCGLASGMVLNHLKPLSQIDLTYSGISFLDEPAYLQYIETYWCGVIDMSRVARDLFRGEIVGVVRGNSEHGPRALGNRSILCSPLKDTMKDRLNNRVKHREPWRPYGAVVRLEDVSTYFEWEGESRWMCFSPQVKEDYKPLLPAITHVDGSCRIQTVTKEQNGFLYDLLTLFKDLSGIGVLLNTSFNIAGKPIVSTYRDAVMLYEISEMDRLVIGEFYLHHKDNLKRKIQENFM